MSNPDNDNEFEELMKDESLTEESLNDRLNSYAKAFREEFEEKSQADPSNVEAYTRDFFRKNVHSAAAQIVHLANNAFSESVKLRAAELVVKEARLTSDEQGDPVKEILQQLTSKKK